MTNPSSLSFESWVDSSQSLSMVVDLFVSEDAPVQILLNRPQCLTA